MLHVELVLAAAHERQAALRHAAALPGAVRFRPVRRRVGAWLVRLGRTVGGPTVSSPAWQG